MTQLHGATYNYENINNCVLYHEMTNFMKHNSYASAYAVVVWSSTDRWYKSSFAPSRNSVYGQLYIYKIAHILKIYIYIFSIYIYIYIYKGKVIPLQARCGPQGE